MANCSIHNKITMYEVTTSIRRLHHEFRDRWIPDGEMCNSIARTTGEFPGLADAYKDSSLEWRIDRVRGGAGGNGRISELNRLYKRVCEGLLIVTVNQSRVVLSMEAEPGCERHAERYM